MPASVLIGTWALVSTEWKRADGRHANPFGEGATGILIYSAAGYMSAQIMRASRHAAGQAHDSGAPAGIDAAIAAGVPGYVAYFGEFSVDDARHTVTHHVIGATHPSWVGLAIARRFDIDGNILTLRDEVMAADGVAVAAATSWQRIGGA